MSTLCVTFGRVNGRASSHLPQPVRSSALGLPRPRCVRHGAACCRTGAARAAGLAGLERHGRGLWVWVLQFAHCHDVMLFPCTWRYCFCGSLTIMMLHLPRCWFVSVCGLWLECGLCVVIRGLLVGVGVCVWLVPCSLPYYAAFGSGEVCVGVPSQTQQVPPRALDACRLRRASEIAAQAAGCRCAHMHVSPA